MEFPTTIPGCFKRPSSIFQNEQKQENGNVQKGPHIFTEVFNTRKRYLRFYSAIKNLSTVA